MHQATNTGTLQPVPDCTITIPIETQQFAGGQVNTIRGTHVIQMNNLPDISDTKSAIYNNEGIIGRSFPLYTYSHSGDRQISMQLHFFAVDSVVGNDGLTDVQRNLKHLRAIQSATYPRTGNAGGAPYRPPPVCRLRCGSLLANSDDLCAVLQSYSVKFPTEVAWETRTGTLLPYRFDVDTSWLTVYTSEDLPTATRIFTSGR